MAERSTAAVGVADSGESEGKTLSDRTDATDDGATHGDGPQDTAPEVEEGGAEDSATRAESSDTAEPKDAPEAAEHPDTSVEGDSPSDEEVESPPEAVAEDASIGSAQPTAVEPSASPDADADADVQPAASGRAEAPEDAAEEPEPPGAEEETAAPELHSGHKLARRYRLEECVTRLDGFSSWRAVDEKLRRAVGVHVLPAAHPRARKVLAAARSAALLGDPRFVQVLDAVEEGELVYVVHEWLVDAVPLNDLLLTAPLEPHEAYQLISQLSQGMAAAHREGLAHLRLGPSCVLRTGVGQYRIRGLAVNAALRGVTSDEPSRTDTEAVGALLYAALTQRWPYEEDAYGLSGVGGLAGGTLIAPDQVRAGVHRGLSALAMRALVNDGATPSRQDQPCATPDELAKAVAELPRIRPPEPAYQPPAAYARRQSSAVPPGAPATGTEPPAPPALPGRTGKALKWGVSALLIAALGLGSWQVADALLKGDTSNEKPAPAPTKEADPTGEPIKVAGVEDFDPESADGQENPEDVDDAVDGDPTTYWPTSKYYGQPNFGNLKSGVGLILDLGKLQQVSEVQVDFLGTTRAEIHAAPRSATGMPTSLGGFEKVSGGTGEKLKLKAKKPVRTQYVLLWLTKLPLSEDGNYRGRVAEVRVLS